MAHTDALGDFIQRLHTDSDLQQKFQSDPAEALEGFEVTHHEHDAVVTRDLDDLVAVGAAHEIAALPEVLRGDHVEEPGYDLPDHLRVRLERIEANILHLFEHGPRPEIPRTPLPGPIPQPGPGPQSESAG